jgi:hypothetical protein
VGLDGGRLRDRARDQVVGADARERVGERARVTVGGAVVDEPQVAVAVLGEQRLGLADVDQAAHEVRRLALLRVGLQAPREVVGQQGERSGARDRGVAVRVTEPVQLAVEDEAGARLEDVVLDAEEAHVAGERRPRASRHRDDERARAVARLERAQPEQGEAPVAVARHRPAGAEQRRVEVDVQAAHPGIVASVR